MNVLTDDAARAATPAASRLAIADCDIHPVRKDSKNLHPYLSKQWREHLDTFGKTGRDGWETGAAYIPNQPNAARRDAWPPEGGPQGSSLSFLQAQHLDPNNVQLGILNPLRSSGSGQGARNPDLANALCAAVNDWQVAEWTSLDSRLKASVIVNNDDAPAAVAEIHKRAGDKNFAQVMLFSRPCEPLGARRYWPVYEAAVECGFPIGVHAFGYGGNPVTGGGWPSYYIEEMVGHAQSSQAGVTSLVFEGTLERFPALKVIMIEAGFAWGPPTAWRLDKIYRRLHAELPRVKKLPSEYIRQQIWWSSQPMEEPDAREDLLDMMQWMGWDRLMFATDYPHWDYDDPAACLPLRIPEQQRRDFFLNNALKVYGIAG